MHRSRPLRQPYRQNPRDRLGLELAKKANHFSSFVGPRSLQYLGETLNRFVTEALPYLREKFANLPKARMAKSTGNVLQGGLGHQRQDVGKAVGNFSRTQAFLDEFRDSIFGADPGPQALCRPGALRFA